jgi:histidine phosphotransferase ChpT
MSEFCFTTVQSWIPALIPDRCDVSRLTLNARIAYRRPAVLISPETACMSGPIALEALDLAALLCSRVCHDLISPVGAIANGLELMEDDKNEETQKLAMDLIRKSARTASARLQFCRIAFGAAGSAGAQVDTGDAEKVTRGLLEDEKTKVTWNLPRLLLPKNRVKLLLNMLLIAGQTIPRGGLLTVDPVGEGESMGFRVAATGANVRLPQAVPGLLAGAQGDHAVDAHAIQPFYAGLLARNCGLAAAVTSEGDKVVVTAQ